MQSAKDVAASAKSGMEKTKATLQEKGEKMTSRDPLQKEMATEKKEERIDEAERHKREAKHRNAAATGAHNTGAAGGGLFGGPTDEEDDMDLAGTGTGTGTGTRNIY